MVRVHPDVRGGDGSFLEEPGLPAESLTFLAGIQRLSQTHKHSEGRRGEGSGGEGRGRERALDGARGRETGRERARTGTAGCLSDFTSPSSQSELRGQIERISAVLDSGNSPRLRNFLTPLFSSFAFEVDKRNFLPLWRLFFLEMDSRRPAAGSDWPVFTELE
ncbi:hypothetical protein CHARACLAT_008355 [Characodon lateralis]|uniref:Uncharacterized protein n=1 Tax=Characodon lateralis TaxID=208331 RepID=A0ABU7CVX2_9TELE|nr:hypothetical protein [Characodon lateralis]